MRITIGELISPTKNILKTLTQDNRYVTDQTIYSLFKRNFAPLLQREDSKMKILTLPFIFQPYLVELREVDKVEAGCAGITSGCTIMRSREKLPPMFKGYYGELIRSVYSLDRSEELTQTTAEDYVRKTRLTTFRYNKTKYFWVHNDYLYSPSISWDALMMDAAFEDEVGACDEDPCLAAQDMEISLPDYLISAAEKLVWQDLGLSLQIPPDPVQDKQSNT